MKKTVFVALAVLLLTGCTSDSDFEKGKRQLENQGYTLVSNTGVAVFCCGQDDSFSTGFWAKDKDGRVVTGCFCSGLAKGVTVRFE